MSNELNCYLEFGENSVVNLLHRPRFLENEIRFSASIMEEESSKGKVFLWSEQNVGCFFLILKENVKSIKIKDYLLKLIVSSTSMI